VTEPRNRRVLVATVLGIFVTSFPVVILVAALPDIAKDFHVGDSSASWVLTAPMISGAVFLPLFGRLGDVRGHRQVFLTGFTAAGVLALFSAMAPSLGALIVLRTASQAAGTATSPTALAMLLATHVGDERPRALAAWAFAGASAPVVGLLAGGPFVGVVGWRGVFVLEAIVIAAALPFSMRALPSTERRTTVGFDVAGALLLMAASGAAVFALDRSAHWGFAAAGVLAAAVLAPVLLYAFVRVERRSPDPLFPLTLLRRRGFVAPMVADTTLQLPCIGGFFLAPIVLHTVFDQSVVASAYLLIPMPLGMALLAPLGGRLSIRIGERRTAVIGAVVMIVAIAVQGIGYATEVLPLAVLGFFGLGASIGLNQPAVASAAAAALDASTTGVGMAVTRMMASLGAAAGVSVAVAATGDGRFGVAYVVLTVLAVLATVMATRVVDEQPDAMDVAMGLTTTVPAFD
jgi:MFS family permease